MSKAVPNPKPNLWIMSLIKSALILILQLREKPDSSNYVRQGKMNFDRPVRKKMHAAQSITAETRKGGIRDCQHRLLEYLD